MKGEFILQNGPKAMEYEFYFLRNSKIFTLSEKKSLSFYKKGLFWRTIDHMWLLVSLIIHYILGINYPKGHLSD